MLEDSHNWAAIGSSLLYPCYALAWSYCLLQVSVQRKHEVIITEKLQILLCHSPKHQCNSHLPHLQENLIIPCVVKQL